MDIDFSLVRNKLSFTIGVQTFTLDYEPEEESEYEFMCEMLKKAFEHYAKDGVVGEEFEFQLIQDDECMSSTYSKNRADALKEILNYATVYAQDGPVEIFEVIRKKIDIEKETK